jgi:hypothetical protein
MITKQPIVLAGGCFVLDLHGEELSLESGITTRVF